MQNASFNIATEELVKLTNKLEKLHKSAMPVAVRQTLNDAAYDMKVNQIEPIFISRFTIRKKTFIRSHTAFNKSPNTFNLSAMYSEAGVIKGKSNAGDNLINQEFGGRESREYIPTKESRVGKTSAKLVRRKYYLQNIKKQPGQARYQNQNFIKAAFKAGKGGFIMYSDMMFKILTIKKTKGKLFIKSIPVYSVKPGRNVTIKKRPFLKPAEEKTIKKMNGFYYDNAKKRFEKYMK